MFKGFCHSCQLFVDTITGFCGTCNDLVEITETGSNTNLNTFIDISEPFPPVSESFTSISVADQTQISSHNYERYPQNTAVNQNSGYVNKNTGLQGNIYNPSFNNKSTDSKIAGSEGYSILTLGIIGLLVFVGLGFGITYTRAYFAAMPDAIAKAATDARNNPDFQRRAAEYFSNQQTGDANNSASGSTQKPWFSSWFRSNPTAEEVFEKYDKETLVDGKFLSIQSMFLSGKMSISKIKPKNSNTSNDIAVTSDFEMSMKAPNKAFMKMEMQAEQRQVKNFNQPVYYDDYNSRPAPNIKAGVIAGSDGTNKWSVTKTLVNGSIRTQESNGSEENNVDKALNSPDAFVFNRGKYQNAEFLGIENVGVKRAYLLKAFKQNGESDLLYFDIETGLIINFVTKEYKMLIKTYGRFEGLKMPSSFQIEMPEMTFQMDILRMQPDVPFDDSIFLRSSYK
jgi:hypothetical protein